MKNLQQSILRINLSSVLKKKDCKCWICQEIGHYSYECPNTKSNKAQAKAFKEIAMVYDLTPLEDAFEYISSDEELYLMESSSDNRSEDDSSSDSSSEDQDKS